MPHEDRLAKNHVPCGSFYVAIRPLGNTLWSAGHS